MRRFLTAAALAGLLGALLSGPVAAREPATVWLCAPGLAADPCQGGLPTTDERTGKTTTAPESRPVDCFYVYPTVSQDLTPNASLKATPPVVSIARHQAARFSDVCEVWAPIYRQRTLTALAVSSLYGPELQAETARIAYGDVLRAWKEYLARTPEGRGVVLIGHSQGTGVLRRLIREEIDQNPSVRARLVSGLLLGGTVAVRKGSDRDGDFKNVPLCRAEDQTGCVLSFASFSKTPGKDSLFGRVPATDNGSGFPYGPDYEAACTNPASLRHNSPEIAKTILRTDPVPGLLGVAAFLTYLGPPPTAATPWLIPSDRYVVECARENGAHVLRITGLAGARALHPAPLPTWGTHLLDVNIALGDLLRIVARQTAAYGA
ncbi:DUF3089 domain-containing protein [Actinocorallia sp. A-T 12471]|uniref:DUF3089 domain-containing protein n=1 Tax=Actinocorallia sp. A-T 12471 TaxID=3089813 RepID=UPI0029D1AF2A|nr:DUF3089 domain-containing protein [Actinocorallia sp. A-T 12471]MDX6739426.1 DUF3089 domain-containing protein [Actinocorallia sp. A-T 12471]